MHNAHFKKGSKLVKILSLTFHPLWLIFFADFHSLRYVRKLNMDDWEKFNETSLPEKEFYRNLNMEDITDGYYIHAKRICKDFEIKKLGEYHYLKSDTLLSADVFVNFRKMCLKIYQLGPVKFFSAPGLA